MTTSVYQLTAAWSLIHDATTQGDLTCVVSLIGAGARFFVAQSEPSASAGGVPTNGAISLSGADGDKLYAKVSTGVGSIIINGDFASPMGPTEAAARAGRLFYVRKEQGPILANGGTYLIGVTTGAKTTIVRDRLVKFTSDDGIYEVFSGASYTGGTALDIVSFGLNPPAPDFSAHAAPTVGVLGTLKDEVPSYGSLSAGNRPVGSSTEGFEPRTLAPNSQYIVRFTNRSTATDATIYYRLNIEQGL